MRVAAIVSFTPTHKSDIRRLFDAATKDESDKVGRVGGATDSNDSSWSLKVRRAACVNLATKVNIKALTIRQRTQLVRRGLSDNDRNPLDSREDSSLFCIGRFAAVIRHVTEHRLIGEWLKSDSIGGCPSLLLHYFNPLLVRGMKSIEYGNHQLCRFCRMRKQRKMRCIARCDCFDKPARNARNYCDVLTR